MAKKDAERLKDLRNENEEVKSKLDAAKKETAEQRAQVYALKRRVEASKGEELAHSRTRILTAYLIRNIDALEARVRELSEDQGIESNLPGFQQQDEEELMLQRSFPFVIRRCSS